MFLVIYVRNEKKWRTKPVSLWDALEVCRRLKRLNVVHHLEGATKSRLWQVPEDPLLAAWTKSLACLEKIVGPVSTQA